MPNWVTNHLIFKNEEDAGIVFCAMQWHKKRFSFKALIPHPATEAECPEKYKYRTNEERAMYEPSERKPWFDWYNFHYEQWGCKWDCRDAYWCQKEIVFKTAWNQPCKELLQLIANKFHVSFKVKSWDETEDEDIDEPSRFPTKNFRPKES